MGEKKKKENAGDVPRLSLSGGGGGRRIYDEIKKRERKEKKPNFSSWEKERKKKSQCQAFEGCEPGGYKKKEEKVTGSFLQSKGVQGRNGQEKNDPEGREGKGKINLRKRKKGRRNWKILL